jgi:hypothetical protein
MSPPMTGDSTHPPMQGSSARTSICSAASEGLGTVFRGAVDQRTLGQKLGLAADQFVTFAQSVGYPKV